eukprot:2044901-Prymnesium_polylepis.1
MSDPVVEALNNLDSIFASCKGKDVDTASSVEAVIEEGGFVLLAWKMGFDATTRQMADPVLVGIATLSDFLSTSSFSTDAQSISTQDYQTLRPYFGSRYLYIDAMCSKAPGVGRLLVLHAYSMALQQKREGVIALSYSVRRSSTPESKKIFQALRFDTIIPNANFNVQIGGRSRLHTHGAHRKDELQSDVAMSRLSSQSVDHESLKALDATTELLWSSIASTVVDLFHAQLWVEQPIQNEKGAPSDATSLMNVSPQLWAP